VQVVPVPPPHEPLACRYLVVTEGGRTGRKVSFVELPESLSRLLLAVSCLVRKGQRAVCLININLTCGSVTAADDPAASRQAGKQSPQCQRQHGSACAICWYARASSARVPVVSCAFHLSTNKSFSFICMLATVPCRSKLWLEWRLPKTVATRATISLIPHLQQSLSG
jgi:hypothetical protein